tara:strand:- start:803 stop:991 length:189 start_codon:yes stop_codon:yes gene_type:complete
MMIEKREDTPEQRAAPLLPVAILGSVVLAITVYLFVGSMLLDEDENGDAPTEPALQEQPVGG